MAVHTVRAAVNHRLTGHAAEMSFFALLTLVPSTVAVGAALGFLQRFVGPQRIARGQDEAIAALRVLMSPRLTDEVIARSCERSSASSAAASRSAGWS